jgi:hypothetical protein
MLRATLTVSYDIPEPGIEASEAQEYELSAWLNGKVDLRVLQNLKKDLNATITLRVVEKT